MAAVQFGELTRSNRVDFANTRGVDMINKLNLNTPIMFKNAQTLDGQQELLKNRAPEGHVDIDS